MTKAQESNGRTQTTGRVAADKVQLSFTDGRAIAIITLNDPKLGNPMSPEMGDAFTALVGQLKQLGELRAVIIRGAGQNFSVGGHRDMLTTLADPKMSAKARHDFMLGFYDRWLSLLDVPVPVIAAIEGDCIGVAPIFACASDICVADETANFQITFAGLGLYPGMAMSYLVPKLVGAQQAVLLMVAANIDGVTRPLTQALRVRRSELQPMLESDATRQAESYSTREFREQIAGYLPGWYDGHEAR